MNDELNSSKVTQAETEALNAAFESLDQSRAEAKAAIDKLPPLPFALRHPVATAIIGYGVFLAGVVGMGFARSYVSEAGKAKARKHFG